MDSRQKALARMARSIANEWIGGLENTMLDYDEGSEEYESAKADLSQSHETWVGWIVGEVKINREAQKHLKFAGNNFLKDCVDKLLLSMGY